MVEKRPLALIEMENGAVVKVELDPENAPNTVNNFISLASSGFYNGLTFHRTIPGFMIQGGCPEGRGTGGPGYKIKGEFSSNSHENKIHHQRGVISMARSGHPDSAGSQFFITVDDVPHLDGDYAAFGTVIADMEAVDEIALTPCDERDCPVDEQKIKSIKIETFSVEYDPPEKA